jgi:hypothetical protein
MKHERRRQAKAGHLLPGFPADVAEGGVDRLEYVFKKGRSDATHQ